MTGLINAAVAAPKRLRIPASRSTWFYADVWETADGTEVHVWKHWNDGAVRKLLLRTTLNCPFHIACDKVLALVNQLDPPGLEDRPRRIAP
jgi:hypothetical protein